MRIGTSRVSLDLVVEQYENGMSPEEIVRAWDTLVLTDVYAVISYYLRHRAEVTRYLIHRKVGGELLRQQVESQGSRLSREELIRRSAKEKVDAPAGQ